MAKSYADVGEDAIVYFLIVDGKMFQLDGQLSGDEVYQQYPHMMEQRVFHEIPVHEYNDVLTKLHQAHKGRLGQPDDTIQNCMQIFLEECKGSLRDAVLTCLEQHHWASGKFLVRPSWKALQNQVCKRCTCRLCL